MFDSWKPCRCVRFFYVFHPFDHLTSVSTSVRTSLRTYVRGQRFLRSVWVNWFETLGQEQVRSEDYARQIDFLYHSKWRPGGHLGCKLGAVTRRLHRLHRSQIRPVTTPTGFLSNLVQRECLGWPTCMPIYFLFDLKNGDMAAIFVFLPP